MIQDDKRNTKNFPVQSFSNEKVGPDYYCPVLNSNGSPTAIGCQ